MDPVLAEKLSALPGVGPARQKLLAQAGLSTLGDLLEYYPRDYLDQTNLRTVAEIREGEEALIRARLASKPINLRRNRKVLTQAWAGDGTGRVRLLWFNQPFLVKNLAEGEEYLFRGKAKLSGAGFELVSPKYQKAGEDLPGLSPVYPLWAGMTQKNLQNLMAAALERAGELSDPLPETLRTARGLVSRSEALRAIHMPDTEEELRAGRRRLVFEEFFVQQLALLRERADASEETGGAVIGITSADEAAFLDAMPFSPTSAQRRAWDEIKADLAAGRAMNRLVQGDVGCGKTWVAEIALFAAAKAGFQGAMMAPTEVLARQHHEELSRRLEPFGIRVGLLCGSVKGAERREVLEGLSDGTIAVAVGTHALIQDAVDFQNLGLVITDEQHRFGVRQRLCLLRKGSSPNVLIMTATPIPRTLAITVYGDMDVSIIDELPPGRTPVKTYKVDGSYEERLIAFMKKQMDAGHQVYVICPAVEENEEFPLRSAEQYFAELQNGPLREYRLGLLHGRMSGEEKDAVMSDFAAGLVQLLVSTTVVEVGVNVPNATLMIVENAERFGLAQLHQLRGRVGRGSAESFCVLVSDALDVPETAERLDVLTASGDGFFIAEEDLRLRGSGDIFGLRQSGLPQFKIADILRDQPVLREAREAAAGLLREDPTLSLPENAGAAELADSFLEQALTNG